MMEDGEIELSSSNSNARGSMSVGSMDARTCIHTHTCNPPGPDIAHAHTCYHTHTQVISSGGDTETVDGASSLKPRKVLGNREAVRKYREKKKAHTAYLEEEVKKLRVLNQQLVRKVQGQAVLKAEILRLRALLFDLKGKIDIELGSFPFEKCSDLSSGFGFKEGDCGMQGNGSVDAVGLQCQTLLSCLKPRENHGMCVGDCGSGGSKAVFSWEGGCVPENGENGFDNPVNGAETLVSAENQGQ